MDITTGKIAATLIVTALLALYILQSIVWLQEKCSIPRILTFLWQSCR